MELQKDIKTLNKVMGIKEISEVFENYFSWLYLFSNENISAFFQKLDFQNKNILAVTGSGDYMLNAYLHGATSVESFDMNPLAKYLSELKVAAIKSLSREEFLIFFNNSFDIFKIKKYFFNKSTY